MASMACHPNIIENAFSWDNHFIFICSINALCIFFILSSRILNKSCTPKMRFNIFLLHQEIRILTTTGLFFFFFFFNCKYASMERFKKYSKWLQYCLALLAWVVVKTPGNYIHHEFKWQHSEKGKSSLGNHTFKTAFICALNNTKNKSRVQK